MEPGIILRSLCEQHPESVARLFEAHKVGLAPSAENIVSAYKSLGNPFLTDLNGILTSYANFEGEHPRSGFGKALDSIGSYFKDREQLRLYNEGRLAPRNGLIPMRSPNGGVVYVPAQPQVYTTEIDFATGNAYTEPFNPGLPDRIFGINKNLFLVLAGALAMVVFMELFQRKGR